MIVLNVIKPTTNPQHQRMTVSGSGNFFWDGPIVGFISSMGLFLIGLLSQYCRIIPVLIVLEDRFLHVYF